MGFPNSIIDENRNYWTWRARGYSELNRQELETEQRKAWKERLKKEIGDRFPGRVPSEIRVLDIGTGPGFLAILLSELGYEVTAIDLTKAMLVEAEGNAERFYERRERDERSEAGRICFLEMNAEELMFADASFDVVVSRNLTWDLPHPEDAYAEWVRVLRPDGLLLNFDANWYAYLFNDEAREGYEFDRKRSAESGISDLNVGENFDIMEKIARRVPLSKINRPAWDVEALGRLGLRADADEGVWRTLWSEREKVNLASTPLFLVRGKKSVV